MHTRVWARGVLWMLGYAGITFLAGTINAGSNVMHAPEPSAGVPPVFVNCGFVPLEPADPASPRSSASCASTGFYRVDCGEPSCDAFDELHPPPTIVSRRTEVVGGVCSVVEESVEVTCAEIVELELLPAACTDPASASREGIFVRADGVVHISGEDIILTVLLDTRCGLATCVTSVLDLPDPELPERPLLCAPEVILCPAESCELPAGVASERHRLWF